MFGRIVVGVMLGVVAIAVMPFGVAFQLLTLQFKARRYALAVGEAISQLLNATSAELLNATLRKGGVKFGNPDRTTSGVLGELDATGALTFAGEVIVSLLDYVDPGHCAKAYDRNK